MTNPLYDQLLKAIEKNVRAHKYTRSNAAVSVEGINEAAKACQTISEEWAKGAFNAAREEINVSSDDRPDYIPKYKTYEDYKNSEHGNRKI